MDSRKPPIQRQSLDQLYVGIQNLVFSKIFEAPCFKSNDVMIFIEKLDMFLICLHLTFHFVGVSLKVVIDFTQYVKVMRETRTKMEKTRKDLDIFDVTE